MRLPPRPYAPGERAMGERDEDRQPDVEEFRARGLYDPDAENAEDRLELLRFLAGNGVAIEDMVDADREGWLPYAAFRHVVRGEGRLTLRDAAARVGIEPERGRRLWQAAGFPDPDPEAPIFTEDHLEAFQVFAAAEAVFGEEATLQVTRVIGSSMARIAEAELSAWASSLGARLIQEEGEAALARSNVQIAQLMPMVARALDVLHRDHLDAGNRRLMLTVDSVRAASEATPLAVGFIDVVGYTALSATASQRDLGALVTDFESISSEVITARGGRVVKMIGDEAMFVVPSPAAACEMALSIFDRFESRGDDSRLRGGLAFGDVLARHGDYFGPVVNVAARLVGIGPPGEILVDDALRGAVEDGDGFSFEPVGEQTLKGFEKPVAAFRLTR